MRIILITLMILLISVKSFSQKKCDCANTLSYVTKQIEENSASFAHQVIEYKRKSEYIKHKNHIQKIAKTSKTEKECLGVIQYYLSFLRDSHQRLIVTTEYYPFKTFDDTINVKQFWLYSNYRVI